MARMTGVLIDNDPLFNKELIRAFDELNIRLFVINDYKKITEIRNHIHIIPIFFLINIKSGDIEGLGIYKMLQNYYSNEEVRFYFLLNTESYSYLLNHLKIKIRYFIKSKNNISYIVSEIYKDAILSSIQQEGVYKQILKTNLKELPIEILLKYCEDFYFTGNLILKRMDQLVTIQYHKGLIEKIQYKDYGMEEALEKILEWHSGTIVLEAKVHSVTEIKEMYEYIFNLTPEKWIPLEELLDLYYDWISEYTGEYSLLKYLKYSYLELMSIFSILEGYKDNIFRFLEMKEESGIYLNEENIPAITAWLKLNTWHLSRLNDRIRYEDFIKRLEIHLPDYNTKLQIGKYFLNFDPENKSFVFMSVR